MYTFAVCHLEGKYLTTCEEQGFQYHIIMQQYLHDGENSTIIAWHTACMLHAMWSLSEKFPI